MKELLAKVREFHEAFGITVNQEPTNNVGEEYKERMRLLFEEVTEYYSAARSETPRETAGELADIIFLALGCVCIHGLQDHFAKVFDEIWRSNMTKLWADGKPRVSANGKFMKPGTYEIADLSFIPLPAHPEWEALISETEGNQQQDNDWEPFDGTYDKVFYDVKLKDGKIYHKCWPNAGRFHPPLGDEIKGAEVTHIRYACQTPY